MAGNEVRIIGGMWRGRKLTFPATAGLRPTLGRTRETLFNWLASDVHDAHCLDLFAGSGALGLEALSRGAGHVTFVERNRHAATAIRRNLNRLGAGNAAVYTGPAERFLRRFDAVWDILFLDPPFSCASLPDVLQQVRKRQLLAAGGLIYVERPGREAPEEFPGWQIKRWSRAGDTQFGLIAPA